MSPATATRKGVRAPKAGARRAAALIAAGVVTGVLIVGSLGVESGSGGDGYLVRAVFDNASFIIPGEDLRIGGVTAGAIDSVDLTPDFKAAVVLRVDDAAFKPFRRDAHCAIRLQSLIGEQYVECAPTRPHGEGVTLPGPLPAITSGPGKGQHLLSVSHTETPVGVDLVNDIMRLPQRERFGIIISDLGAGLAANGDALRAALHRASPALQQTDRVIAVLAKQDKLLARLTGESDRILAPWAKRRREFAGWFDKAGKTAAAAAQRGDDIERNFARFPAFLKQLKPASDRFGAMADQMTPALESLRAKAPTINETVTRLGPFTAASKPALVTFGAVAAKGRKAFPALNPLARRLGDFAAELRPTAHNLALLGSSFDKAGGVEQLMRFIYYYAGSLNGEDELGHYLRSYVNIGACAARLSTPASGCESTFDKSGETNAATATASASDPESHLLDYLLGKDTAKR